MMKILVERYPYAPNLLQDRIPQDWLLSLQDGRVMLNRVGYYRSPYEGELFLIVPKIFETTPHHFDNIPLEQLAQHNVATLFKDHARSASEIDYIYRFALSLYLSLREFQRRTQDSTIIRQDYLQNILSTLSDNETSELDCVMSLVEFFRNNRDLIIFKVKQAQSQQFKKTDWRKTVQKTMPVLINDKTPLYTQTIQKQQEPNNEAEIFTIYFSLMRYFHTEYGLNTRFDASGLTLIDGIDTPSVRQRLVKRLKTLKNQYFTDKLKQMLLLMLQYFEKKDNARTQQGKPEYVLCQDYHLVFEDMIDKLLSDTDYERKLKEQSDGKIVDHIFKGDSLFMPDPIWYIGDSKYYKPTTAMSENAIYKQHTYAKNIIQYNINLFNNPSPDATYVRYRDALTEGYNITPNFFIQAYINPLNFTDTEDNFRYIDGGTHLNKHFYNRVFDRDSLSIHTFNINFIFVFQSYITASTATRQQFKAVAKLKIYTAVSAYYQQQFRFYTLQPAGSVEAFVEKYFKILNGKIYRSSKELSNNKLILGLEKDATYATENENIMKVVHSACIVTELNID
jgi:hypothetical protein